jgi:hypothetical protein
VRVTYRLSLAAVAVLACWAAIWHTWGFLYGLGVHPYPASSSTPWTYQMWSGIVPALTVISLLGSLGAAYHLHNCHYESCWRLGKHRVGGTPWCNRHLRYAQPERSAEELLSQIVDLLSIPNPRSR